MVEVVFRKMTFLIWLFATRFFVTVQTEKLDPERVQQLKDVESSREKKTGCMCPAVIDDGYINSYCGRELKTNGKSGAICNTDGLYRCVIPAIEAVEEADCEISRKVCKQGKCFTKTDNECKPSRKRMCVG